LEIGDIGATSYELEDFNLISEVVELPRGEVKETAYTRSRRISYSTLAAYGVQATADSIIFPFTDLRGKVTGTMSRYTDPEKVGTRYKIHGKRQPLWPMHWLKERATLNSEVVVVEGAWSAMSLYQWDHYFVLSLMGAKAGAEIVEILAPFQTVYLYDDDVAGRNACKKMRRLGVERAYVLPVAPDDMSVEQLEELTGKLDKLWRRE
jgi:DNA primase